VGCDSSDIEEKGQGKAMPKLCAEGTDKSGRPATLCIFKTDWHQADALYV
jgi:hypothetical protein